MASPLPGWLLKRARDLGATAVHIVLPPATPTSPAVYFLEYDGEGMRGICELHIVDDASSDVVGGSIVCSGREMIALLRRLTDALTGRGVSTAVPPVSGAASVTTDDAPAASLSAAGADGV